MTARDDYTNQMAANLKQWSTQIGDLQAKMGQKAQACENVR